MAADSKRATLITVVELGQAYTANTNVPGVLREYGNGETVGEGEDAKVRSKELDFKGNKSSILILKNGTTPLWVGKDNTEGDIYPGDNPINGDIKCTADLAENDRLVIFYGPVGYHIVGGA